MKSSRVFSIIILLVTLIGGCGRPLKQTHKEEAPEALPAADCFKVVCGERGMVRITGGDLAAAADISSLDPQRLNLYCGGKPIPTVIEGGSDGSLDPGDSIIFYCAQSNPRSPVDVFRLRYTADGEKPLRYKQTRIQVVGEKSAITTTFAVLQANRGSVRTGGILEVSKRNVLPNDSAVITATTPAAGLLRDGGIKATLLLRLRRTQAGEEMGVKWKAALRVGNTPLTLKQKVKGLYWELSCEIPQSLFVGENDATLEIILDNESDHGQTLPENFVAATFTIVDTRLKIRRAACAFNGQGGIQVDDPRQALEMHIPGFTAAKARVFYPDAAVEITGLKVEGKDGRYTAMSGLYRPGEYVIVQDGAYIVPRVEPYEIESANKEFPQHPDLKSAGNEADYLIIVPGEFMGAIQPLAEHRRQPRRDGLSHGEKFRVMTVDAQEIYDQFDHGRFGPRAIKDFLYYAGKNWKRAPRYVLLAADACADRDPDGTGRTIPAYQYDTYFCGRVGTDNWYVTWGKEGVPELAVGRLPADSREELEQMAAKIIEYETASERGPWRRRLDVFVGTAGYGPEIEALLQRMFKLIFGSMMHRAFDLEITYAGRTSSYYYPAGRFNRRFIERINDGALVTVYVGHGAVRHLDHIYEGDRAYPILEVADVTKLSCAGHRPVMFIIACNAGAFDLADRDCLAEEIARTPGAPVAVIASSWVSHMYSNGVFGIEMLPAFFAGTSSSTGQGVPERRDLGSMMNRLKMRSVKGSGVLCTLLNLASKRWVSRQARRKLKVDNQFLYNLMGDPALQPALPECDLDLTLDRGRSKPGEKLSISGSCEGIPEGTAVVTLECDITDSLYPAFKMRHESIEEFREHHRQSNDKVILTVETKVKNGRFSLDLTIPQTVEKTKRPLKPGRYFIKVYVTGSKGDAFGAMPVEVMEE